jgi:hypothetical protein
VSAAARHGKQKPPPANPEVLCRQIYRCARDQFTLLPGITALFLARLALGLADGDGDGAIGRTASDFVDMDLAVDAIAPPATPPVSA